MHRLTSPRTGRWSKRSDAVRRAVRAVSLKLVLTHGSVCTLMDGMHACMLCVGRGTNILRSGASTVLLAVPHFDSAFLAAMGRCLYAQYMLVL
mmetsp:Transcript_60053/g.106286  ORF Transcript_60053/g.106286 Transcript_60053/m.106286 type:complete len:93 (-) Transcript_60053:20-298(-)